MELFEEDNFFCLVMSNDEVNNSLSDALQELNKETLLQLLQDGSSDISQKSDLFDLVTEALICHPESSHTATQIIYILSIYGADINSSSQEVESPLLKYLLRCKDTVSFDFVQAFLRCGIDVTIKNKDGESALDYILHSGQVPKNLQELVLSFMPGIWAAVESDDAMSVRRLINQWCNIRTTQNGRSVLQLAFDKGTENIIRVITGIGASMDLAHGVLAGDVQYVRNLLTSNKKLNINIKNLSDRGATPLFYALCDNDCDMVDLLLEKGARVDIGMQGENEMELPLYFAALSNHKVGEYILKKIVPTKPIPVDQLIYKGHNVLFYCIEHDVSADLFEEILRRCSAYVLTHKIQKNISARDYAVYHERCELVARIDKIVSEWIYYSVDKKNRNILALHGYRHVPALKDINSENDGLDDCFLDLTDYENHKILLTQAVEDGDLISVKEMLYYESVLEKGLETCMADCRCSFSGQPLLHKAVLHGYAEITKILADTKIFSGQPLLHKAVLHGYAEITQLLADTIVNVTRQKIDSIRDQYFRTCLHYAYGMENGKEIINILEDHGASEFSMDKDGRSPLAFKDRQGQKEMKRLLQYHLAQDFCKDEPDPWSVPLPMPIMGYISKCLHDHHLKQHGTKAVPCDQYDKIDLKTSQVVISSDSDDFGQQYSQIKQNGYNERTTPKKHVRISHPPHENNLDLKLDPFYEELQNQHKNSDPFKQEVNHSQTGTKTHSKNGVSFNLGKEVNYVFKAGSDYAASQRESLEHSDSMRTSSIDTESEGSEEYEADDSSSEEEAEVIPETFEQKYCKIL